MKKETKRKLLEWLIKYEQIAVLHKCTGERNPLLHSSGKLCGVECLLLFSDAKLAQHFACRLGGLPTFFIREDKGDILDGGELGEEPVFLKRKGNSTL